MKMLNLIIQREYLSRVKKKSFIIMTIFMPFLFVVLAFAPMLLADIKESDGKRIVVIDQTGLYASQLHDFENYYFETVTDNNVVETKPQSDVFAILQINGNLSQNPKAVSIYSEKQAPAPLIRYLDNFFSERVKEDKLAQLSNSANVDQQTLQEIQQILASNRIAVNSIKWDKDGNEMKTSAEVAAVVAIIFSLLIYMFVTTYGATVMHGVIEEKSNRIVEVMISSVRPFDLMMGKIIGIGLVGLTQILIWGLIMIIVMPLSQMAMGQDTSGGMLETVSLIHNINWLELGLCFIAYFVGGYLIYASIFAMFGSTVDNPQDSQQFMLPITVLLIFALYAGMYSVNNPDGPLAFWASMIPLTSPVVMVVRVAFGIPIGELITSLSILFITAILTVKMAAKVYRVGILMYGKKTSLKEIYKWMLYK